MLRAITVSPGFRREPHRTIDPWIDAGRNRGAIGVAGSLVLAVYLASDSGNHCGRQAFAFSAVVAREPTCFYAVFRNSTQCSGILRSDQEFIEAW
jgi:hypothetical protein